MAVAIALGAGVALGGTGFLVARGTGGCDVAEKQLVVSADPAIAPAVSAAASRYNTAHGTDDGCGGVRVVYADSADTAGVLTGGDAQPGTVRPDVWIPESSLWVDLARWGTGRDPVLQSSGSLAASPLVMALPPGTPQDVVHEVADKSWGLFTSSAGRFRLRMLDPNRTAIGMATLLALRQGSGSDGKGLGTLQAVRSVRPVGGTGELTGAFQMLSGSDPTPVLITSEQSVWRYNQTAGLPVDSAVPRAGTAELDFPYAITAGAAAKKELAGQFLAALRSRAAALDLHRIGLDPPRGGSAAAVAAPESVISLAKPGLAAEIQGAWRSLRMGIRVLALVDVAGAAGEPMPGRSGTRLATIKQALGDGFAQLSDDSEVGLATTTGGSTGSAASSTGTLDRPSGSYRALVPVGELDTPLGDGNQRGRLGQTLNGLRTAAYGGGLNDSILAAYRTMKAGYTGDRINVVLVLTGGRRADGTADGALRTQLAAEFDPRRPVNVIGMSFGGTDLTMLRAAAQATRGAAFTIDRPDAVMRLFLNSTAWQLCGAAPCPT